VIETSGWCVVSLTPAHARELSLWEYPRPYERYSLVGASSSAFTDPESEFVAIVDAQGELVGYRSFGPDGRVPGGTYDERALDTGGALRPDLTGRGLGRWAIQLGLQYGWRSYDATALRVTVWSKNQRALKVLRSLGFQDVDTFIAESDGDEYVILTLARP
jgi:RimJ/RimL family protein N-acetyltransferase